MSPDKYALKTPQLKFPQIIPSYREPVPPSGGKELPRRELETKRFFSAIAAQVPIVALPGAGAAQIPFDNPRYYAVFDELWFMLGPTAAAQVIDGSLFGWRMRQEAGGKVIIPPLGDLPQRWPETDATNSWIHPSTMWLQVTYPNGVKFKHGDAVIQEFFNLHGFAVTLNIAYKGHYESINI